MTPWFEQDPDRLKAEKESIRKLSESSEWFKDVQWLEEKESVSVEAVIEAHGHLYTAVLFYPPYFPEAPVSVRPKDPKESWSDHQYNGGTLCLERGPDNWSPEVTGAEMLESTYTLLQGENPKGETHTGVGSRHHLSFGQYLRSDSNKLLVDGNLFYHCKRFPKGNPAIFEGILVTHRRRNKIIVRKIYQINENSSIDVTPAREIDAYHNVETIFGIIVKPVLWERWPSDISRASYVFDILAGVGFPSETTLEHINECSYGERKDIGYALIIDPDDCPCLFRTERIGDRASLFNPILLIDHETEERLPKGVKNMKGKRVSIIGLGSVGSRVALSLARTGAQHFFLVDYDVLLTGNICRHALDNRSLMQHKTQATAAAIKDINRDAEVFSEEIDLTGQENPSVVTSTLEIIGSSDMIIDATGNPRANASLAAVATAHGKPLVWMSVFAGGIGGLVARYRPGIDPKPYEMKTRLDAGIRRMDTYSEIETTDEYAALDEDGKPIVATDADVGTIASYGTQMIIDLLLEQQPSSFPYSMYLVGMKKGWVFREPFHTIPIDFGGTS